MTIPTTTYTRFQWGPIFAGTLFALAITIVLTQFGTTIGLSATSPLRGEANIAAWGVIATGIWLLWVQLLASLGGGYLAGWLRSPSVSLPLHEVELRDGIAGLSTWALGTVAVFIGLSLAGAFATYVSILTETYDMNDNLTNADINKGIIFAFVAGATALLSAAAAWWAGTKGGEHRDNKTDFSHHLTFRKR